MIKKLFSKTFYSLSFLTFLMINGVDAMAAPKAVTDVDETVATIVFDTTCNVAAVCGTNNAFTDAENISSCATSTNTHTITLKSATGGITRSFYKCDGAAVPVATIYQLCINACEYIKSKLKGDVADEQYNISQNTFTKSMCNALRVVTGSAGKTFAAFAIIATGIGFFTGKVSWGLMIGVTAGIAAMFGAPTIVAAISGQDLKTSCAIN